MNETPLKVIHPWVAEGQNKIRFGVSIVNPGPDWFLHRDWAQMVESLDFDSYWVPNHPMILPDCWTTLTMLATTTQEIRLGSLVSCIFYRNPALLARIAAEVDRLSDGRLILGLGIGDLPHEFAQMGLPFLSSRERQQALEETLQIVSGLWEDTPFTYKGTYFQVHEAKIDLLPIQHPHVPILIAGGGERTTLSQVARYADVSNFGAHSLTGGASNQDDIIRKYQVLDSYCKAIERPYEAVLRSYFTMLIIIAKTPDAVQAKLNAVPKHLRALFEPSTITGTPDEVITLCQTLRGAGVQYFIMGTLINDIETIQLLAQEIIPVLK